MAAPNNKRQRPSDHAGKPPHGKRWKPAAGAGAEDGAEADPQAQEASLKAYMFHAVKLLHKACKKSKTFELQKLTRKIKSTREPKEGEVDQAVLADLEAQLTALKALSIDALPPHLLTTRLPKLPSLRSVSFVPSLLSSVPSSTFPELDAQSAAGKARNRVMANKAVGEAWDEVVRAVKKRMGEEVEPAPKKEKEKMDKGKGKEIAPAGAGDAPANGEKRLSKRAERARKAEETKKNLPQRTMEMSAERRAALEGAGEEDDDAGEESSEDEGPVPGSEDELDDDEIARELAAMNDGVGSEGEWSGSDDDDLGAPQSDAEDDDDVASDSSFPVRPPTSKKRQPSLSPSPPPTKKSKPSREPVRHKPVTSSAFLPSLAGGYISYSDSDGEDAKWVKDAEKDDKKGQRKNRRGQRARQAIWEKKYGSAAAHVVKAAGGKPIPADKLKKKGKKGAATTAADPPASDNVEPFDPLHARGGSTNPNAQALGPRRPSKPEGATARGGANKEEKMHPSWEAKRKAAEALKNSAAMKPQGKKITFD
ncbi:hypothetical protein JCM1841_005761 [Sporobolomyces salmonicolor]